MEKILICGGAWTSSSAWNRYFCRLESGFGDDLQRTAMLDICPGMVRKEKINGLKPTMLKGDERSKWNEGKIENIALVPQAYVGNPAAYKYIHADMDKVYESFAKSLYQTFYEVCQEHL